MNDLDFGFDYKDTLYEHIVCGIENCWGLDFEYLGYATIDEDVYFKTEEEAVRFSLSTDAIFEKCRDLPLDSIVVPVYNKEGELLFYLPYDEAIKQKGGWGESPVICGTPRRGSEATGEKQSELSCS